MINQDSSKKKKHVNLSISAEAHDFLKAQAMRNGTNASQMVERLIRDEESLNKPNRIDRNWIKDLDVQTLERLEDYCCQNHTSPAEAVRRWVWNLKVKSNTMRGQLSLFE